MAAAAAVADIIPRVELSDLSSTSWRGVRL